MLRVRVFDLHVAEGERRQFLQFVSRENGRTRDRDPSSVFPIVQEFFGVFERLHT